MSSEALKRNLPRLRLDEVQALVRELYGIEGEFSSQVSERDLSWRLRRDGGETVVVKIANAAEREEIVDFQAIPIQGTVYSIAGTEDHGVKGPQNAHSAVCCRKSR